jgi:hypothetical protein
MAMSKLLDPQVDELGITGRFLPTSKGLPWSTHIWSSVGPSTCLAGILNEVGVAVVWQVGCNGSKQGFRLQNWRFELCIGCFARCVAWPPEGIPLMCCRLRILSAPDCAPKPPNASWDWIEQIETFGDSCGGAAKHA